MTGNEFERPNGVPLDYVVKCELPCVVFPLFIYLLYYNIQFLYTWCVLRQEKKRTDLRNLVEFLPRQ